LEKVFKKEMAIVKKKYSLALSALAAVSGTSYAQSSVTLYGLLDAGLVYNSNSGGHSQVLLSSGNLQGSRWGMRGQEDIGGGLKVLFRLENGFTINNGTLGQGGDEFGRNATVGLETPYGTLNIGRQYDPLTTVIGIYTSAGAEQHGEVTEWGGVYGAHPGDIDNLGGTNRTNNALKFVSTEWNGFKASGFYSMGGQAGEFTDNQIYSATAQYERGPFSAAVGYLNARDPNYSFYGDKPSSNTAISASSANMSGPVFGGFASARSLAIIAGGALYQIGNATIATEFSNVQLRNIGEEPGNGLNPQKLSGNTIFNVLEISGTYHFTTAFQMGVSVSRTNRSAIGKISSADYNQLTLEADYALSKTTDLYMVGVYQKASGEDSTGKAAVASIDAFTASSTSKQAGATIGIRHRF
jgi:predicted porin